MGHHLRHIIITIIPFLRNHTINHHFPIPIPFLVGRTLTPHNPYTLIRAKHLTSTSRWLQHLSNQPWHHSREACGPQTRRTSNLLTIAYLNLLEPLLPSLRVEPIVYLE
ncbi:hypothetical protein M408DRAFT_296272 [Serendipita vermifera MAFF 305830]|uniref:Uncharacterized protein n=1 Tax=Serendipita vermifera MAFF 305830 TaxID=933852 RepID=A0A0C3BDS2_SERVB|nr:hypothetical protein M408DRAFT_296272 [Serendipita vermifera MAFF 305830]